MNERLRVPLRRRGVGAALVAVLTMTACGSGDDSDAPSDEAAVEAGPCALVTAEEIASIPGGVATDGEAGEFGLSECTWTTPAFTLTLTLRSGTDPGETIEERRQYATQFPTWRVAELPDIGDGAIAYIQPTPAGGERLLHLYTWVGGRQFEISPHGGADWPEGSAEYAAVLAIATNAAARV